MLRTLIDELVLEQSSLQTPVARFAEIHDRQPDLADHYRNLIPLTKPGDGEQYAFEVSLDRCTGCKACVSACHSLNGLDESEAWRDTGVLLGGEDAPGWQQTVTTACHHCESPECLNGCPVAAYEKDEDTGIVRHLDDQCIGCSYCILKCPFDVPKYSEKRGIVRKCDMCHQRLAEGEAPACVQACPTEAIRIIKVSSTNPEAAETRRGKPGDFSLLGSRYRPEKLNFLKGAPRPSITLPTTRYIGRSVPDTAVAADRDALVPEHAHWPLVFMLVLTQAGIGLSSTSLFATSKPLLIAGAVLFNLGMISATLHLGQPLKAWRFFLGLRTSWLSREILAFSLFAPIPLVLAILPFTPDFPFKQLVTSVTSVSALLVGLCSVFTSVMIYHDTRRSLWRVPLGTARFFGTVLAFLSIGIATIQPTFGFLASILILLKFLPEYKVLHLARSANEPWSPDLQSARLQLGPLQSILIARVALGVTAAVLALFNAWLALPILLISEILERQLFFQAVHAPKMPGNFGPGRSH